MSTADVFISYARGQSDARALGDHLVAAGVSVFLDEEEIPAGGAFPQHLADGLRAARVVVVFADRGYFDRAWCVYEYRVATAPYRAGDRSANALEHVVVALPAGDVAGVVDQLPPPLAQGSWPRSNQTGALARLVQECLARSLPVLADRLDGLADDAVGSLASGALVPAATGRHPGPSAASRMPASLLERFVGRTDLLWLIHDALDPRGATAAPRSCAIEGSGGMGKSQLAAEYAARYASRHHRGGVVWIDAGGGDDALALQLHEVLRAFEGGFPPLASFGERASDRVAALAAAVRDAIPAGAGDERVLWIVDGVPEPEPGRRPDPLSRWCPVQDRAALLCTSRRSGIEGAHTHIVLRELSVEAGVALLTQAPADVAWLAGDQWRRVVRWLGGWPLGLRLAHTSLATGFLSAKQLFARALGDEPASAFEAEVDALRDEVPEDYVRGVAEVFRASYDSLAAKPSALRSAHLIARLARVPIAEGLLDSLVPGIDRGLLAKRSWIQPGEAADGDGGRTWTMHAVVASYLRRRSDDPALRAAGIGPAVELVALSRWLLDMFSGHTPFPLTIVIRHFRVIAEGISRAVHQTGDAEVARQAAELAFALATWRIHDFDLREVRHHAAALAAAVGRDAELIDRLDQIVRTGSEEVGRSCVSIANGMPESEAAARFLVKHLSDPRTAVRLQVYPTAAGMRQPDLLALPLLSALREELADIRKFAVEFDPQLAEPALLSDIVGELRGWFAAPHPARRRFAAAVFGSVLRIWGRQLDDAGRALLVGELLRAGFADDDADVVTEVANALAELGDARIEEQLRDAALVPSDGTRWRRAVDFFVSYLVGLERPAVPAYTWIVEEGDSTLSMPWPRSPGRKPERFEPLAKLAVETDDPQVRTHVAAVLLGRVLDRPLPASISREYVIVGGHDCWIALAVLDASPAATGRFALAQAVNAAIPAGRLDVAAAIAELGIAADPGFSSPWWWRGQVRDLRGQFAQAADDYTHVLTLTPDFADAWANRGYALWHTGDVEGALRDFDATIRLEENHVGARFGRAQIRFARDDDERALVDIDAALVGSPDHAASHELRAGCLASLERWEPAVQAATEAIRRDPRLANAHYYRAVAYLRLGRVDTAARDLESAVALRPDDARFTGLLENVRNALRPSQQ